MPSKTKKAKLNFEKKTNFVCVSKRARRQIVKPCLSKEPDFHSNFQYYIVYISVFIDRHAMIQGIY